jgi:hypothetical protein
MLDPIQINVKGSRDALEEKFCNRFTSEFSPYQNLVAPVHGPEKRMPQFDIAKLRHSKL